MAKTDNSNNFWWVVKATVVGGLILAAITTSWLTDTLHYWKDAFYNFCHYISVAFWWFFTTWYSLPAGAIVVLVLLSLLALIQNWPRGQRVMEKDLTPEERYTKDVIYKGEWTWSYRNGVIVGLDVCCPVCKTPMKSIYKFEGLQRRVNWFICETCGHQTTRIEGDSNSYQEAVERQIIGNIRRGDHLPLTDIKKPS